MPSYLQKRRRLWYAVLEIPTALRNRFGGKARFKKSLGTDSRTIAERRVPLVIAAWKRDIAAARGEPNDDDAAWHRRALRNAKTPKERNLALELLQDAADDIALTYIDGEQKLSDVPEAQAFYRRAMSSELLTDLEAWLASAQTTPRTKAMYRADVVGFSKSFPLVENVSRPEVKRWAMAKLSDGLSPRTLSRNLSSVRGYWRHLTTLGLARAEIEPFSNLDIARGHNKQSERIARQAFTPKDVVRLLKAARAKGDAQLENLINLARWTGCRIEELCSLKIDHVRKGYFTVHDAKSKAGNRQVPVHSKLSPALLRMTGQSTDGYVISGLSATRYGHRSGAIGHRFSGLKTELGFDSQHVFHSIRKTVATQFEQNLVPEGVAADILGHDKPSMTYGLYSGGASMDVKRVAIEKLNYPVVSREP
jgi:integrase